MTILARITRLLAVIMTMAFAVYFYLDAGGYGSSPTAITIASRVAWGTFLLLSVLQLLQMRKPAIPALTLAPADWIILAFGIAGVAVLFVMDDFPNHIMTWLPDVQIRRVVLTSAFASVCLFCLITVVDSLTRKSAPPAKQSA